MVYPFTVLTFLICALIMTIFHQQVEQCRMPGLAVYLTLDAGKAGSGVAGSSGSVGSSVYGGEGGDAVSFITGLLLSHNHQQRTWFAHFVKSGQRVCEARYYNVVIIFSVAFLFSSEYVT